MNTEGPAVDGRLEMPHQLWRPELVPTHGRSVFWVVCIEWANFQNPRQTQIMKEPPCAG